MSRLSRLQRTLAMTDHRSNAFFEAMNGLLQQAKRAPRCFRTSADFFAVSEADLDSA